MRIRTKVFIAKLKLIPDYGIQAFIPRKIKKIVGIGIIDILIWTSIFQVVFTPRVILISNPAVVEAHAETVSEVSALSGDTERVVSEVQPQSPDDIETLIRQTFHETPDIALAVAKAESGMNPNAIHINSNGTEDRGLFQISNYWHPEVSDECAFNVRCSIKEAKRIWDERGCREWSTCAYAEDHKLPI